MAHRRELEYASRQLTSVEINGTFYSLQKPASFRKWFEEVPEGFCFAVKGSRFITHVRRLADVEVALANFFASGILRLNEKLGPILWQLPQRMRFDQPRLEAFLLLLPRTLADAAACARGHDARVEGRAWTEVEHQGPLLHAVESRDASFRCPEYVELLRRHNVASVVSDGAGRWPIVYDVTADFVYVRLHGSYQLYGSSYSDTELDTWAARVRSWQRGKRPRGVEHAAGPPQAKRRAAYVYFDNDAEAYAAFNAMSLAEKLRGKR